LIETPIRLAPDWAPNLHPLLVHFPIAWLMAGLAVDACGLPRRMAWAETAAAVFYPAGAVAALAAYLTGRQAGTTVFLPGMAHGLAHEHWNWALATTVYFLAFAAVRIGIVLRGRPPSFRMRAALTAGALVGSILLFNTGERGSRLVYEHGVGIRTSAPAPAPVRH
jgi:uncharacterized membrane protein